MSAESVDLRAYAVIRSDWAKVGVLGLSNFAFGTGAFVFGGLLEHLAQDMHVSTSGAGQLQTVYVMSAALLGPFAVARLEKVPAKTVLQFTLLSASLLNLGCFFVGQFSTMLILRLLLGIIAAVSGPLAIALATRLVAPERRGTALAVVMGGMTMAFMVGTPMGTVIGDIYGWRSAFLFTSLLSMSAFVGISILLPRLNPAPSPTQGRVWDALVPNIPIFATSLLIFAGSMTAGTYIATILRLEDNIVGAQIGLFQMIGGVGCFLGLIAGARAVNRGWGKNAIAAFILFSSIAGLLHIGELMGGAPPGTPTRIVIAIASLLGSVALFALLPILQARLLASPSHSAIALTINGSAVTFGQGAGAILGGILLAHYGALALPTAGILLGLLALISSRLINDRATM